MFFHLGTSGTVDLSKTKEITIASPNDPWPLYGRPISLLNVTSTFMNAIFISFSQFSLTQSGAFLTLYTGKTSDTKTKIAQLTGAAFPNDITSYRPYLWLVMETNRSSPTDGFILSLRSPNQTGKHIYFGVLWR